MSSSRDSILGKLKAARRPFEDAAPRPSRYTPVIPEFDSTPAVLIERFVQEMDALKGKAFVVSDDESARRQVLALLREHQIDHVLAWDFAHIPVEALEATLRDAGVQVTLPRLHAERSPELMQRVGSAGGGLSGVDAAIAATATLVLSTGPGKGRLPTVLPPVWISVVSVDQLYPRLEDWLAAQRSSGMMPMRGRANLAFVTGPSRTGDIEMELILGVHGPGTQYVIIKQS
jgi:L-lactate dehydrogenase complex protein LldG